MLKGLCDLLEFPVQIIGLSATLPPAFIPDFCEALNIPADT